MKNLQMLKENKLNPKQKADFYYKMSKILERELIRFEELSSLLEATPDNYLKNIDFKQRAIAAMALTQKLINKTEHAPIKERDGIKYATKIFRVKSFSGLEELNNDIVELQNEYEPIEEDLVFEERMKKFLDDMNNIVNDPTDLNIYTMEEYNSKIRPRLRAHSKTGIAPTSNQILVTKATIVSHSKILANISLETDKIENGESK
jgi:hypothetical protein